MHSLVRSPRVIALFVLIAVVLVGGTIFMKAQDKPERWKAFRNSTWWEYIQVFAVAFVLVFGFMRPFVVEAFKIPSASMEDTLLIGDRILVAKFIYGIKIPFTNYHILDFHKPAVGDIFVFKPPPRAGKTQNFIKRIVALPGDVIEIRNDKLYRNGKRVEDEYYVKRLLFSMDLDFQSHLDNKGISRRMRQVFRNTNNPLSDNVAVSIQEKGSRWKVIDEDNQETYFIRKNEERYRLNVYVSEESYFRRPRAERRAPQNMPPFKLPDGYIFAMGDNRDQSSDSRVWGPVPMENIKGQAFLKYWSWDKDADWLHKIRFSRIGRIVK